MRRIGLGRRGLAVIVLGLTLLGGACTSSDDTAAPVTIAGPTSSVRPVSPTTAAVTTAPPPPSPPSTPPATAPSSDGPGGNLVVYSTDIGGNQDVYLLRLDGSDPVRLTDDPEKEFDADLSPDGTRIAYRRNPRADSDEADIWAMDIDGRNARNLTNAPEDSNWSPAWTSDGRIIYASMRGSGQLQLWRMNADGTGQEQLAEGWCEYPQPSPDGTQFVCAASVGGRYDIVIVSADGTRRSLTTTRTTEFGPSWSPDGEWIAFSRDQREHWELLRIRPDGTEEEVLAAEGVFPAWTPEGWLAWSGIGGINVARPDGSDRRTIDLPAEMISWG